MARPIGMHVTALGRVLKELYGVHEIQAFCKQLVSSINKLVSSELTSYQEFDHQGQLSTWISNNPGAVGFRDSEKKFFSAHMHEHPIIAHYARDGDCGALKVSDFLTRSQFQNLGLYQHFYGRVGVEHQMAFVLPVKNPTDTWIVLNRSVSDFGEDDRLLLNLIRPHLVQAHSNARAISRISGGGRFHLGALESQNSGFVRVNRDGCVSFSESATQLLAKYFSHPVVMRPQLPDALRRWIRKCDENFQESVVPSVLTPFVLEQATTRLVVRLVAFGDEFLLILTEYPKTAGPERFQSFGLSRRESDVLNWVTRGKSNAVIGSIMGLSPRTVQKHLEHIFQKLGVETRTSAAVWALHLTQRNGTPSPPTLE
jgi:DNA-binding CsgD family transcriptional regulator